MGAGGSRALLPSRTEQCIFCDIVRSADDPNSRVIYRSPRLVAFHDIRPAARRHLLVVPRTNVPNVNSLGHQDLQLVQEMHQVGLMLLRQMDGAGPGPPGAATPGASSATPAAPAPGAAALGQLGGSGPAGSGPAHSTITVHLPEAGAAPRRASSSAAPAAAAATAATAALQQQAPSSSSSSSSSRAGCSQAPSPPGQPPAATHPAGSQQHTCPQSVDRPGAWAAGQGQCDPGQCNDPGQYEQVQYDPQQYKFGFHVPPFRSVDHLHLHCMALPHRPAAAAVKYCLPLNWLPVGRLVSELELPQAGGGGGGGGGLLGWLGVCGGGGRGRGCCGAGGSSGDAGEQAWGMREGLLGGEVRLGVEDDADGGGVGGAGPAGSGASKQ